VKAVAVGSATIHLTDGDSGIFSYNISVGGATTAQAKAITRQVLRAPGTTCQ